MSEGASDAIGQVGQEIVNRQLNIAGTIAIWQVLAQG